MFILEKIGLVSSREVEDLENRPKDRFWEDRSFWENMVGRGDRSQTADETRHESHEDPKSRWDKANAVDGKWREVNEKDEEKKTAYSESTASEPKDDEPDAPATLQDNIREISKTAAGIRHQKIREQTYHVLMLAKDIIYEHDIGHNKIRGYSQFENYYVPTLTSVIKNYYSIETRGMANSNMQEDVIAYLEKCGDAFTNLYNSIFSKDIMSMEVQMEAMDIILKRDGLL